VEQLLSGLDGHLASPCVEPKSRVYPRNWKQLPRLGAGVAENLRGIVVEAHPARGGLDVARLAFSSLSVRSRPALRRVLADVERVAGAETTVPRGGTVVPLTEAAKAKLRRYEWPGNVRELQNVIERALITSPDGRRLNLDRALPDRSSWSGSRPRAPSKRVPSPIRGGPRA
jgi:hypothetical protein